MRRPGRRSRSEIMGEAPRLGLTDSPEFKAAVAAEAERAVAKFKDEIVASLAAARGAAGTAPATTDGDWMQALAMSIAALTDQGVGQRKRVSPEIIKAREVARKEMVDLILKARAERKVASYRLSGKVHLDEQCIDPIWIDRMHTAQPTEIDWPGVPNECMMPLNETAKAIFEAFTRSIGGIEAHVAADPLKVTKGGLVVRGRPSAAAHETTINGLGEQIVEGEGVRIKHKDQPGRFKEINILGTIAKPAQQSI